MLNYLNGELYKVFRRSYTWITLGVVLALEALLVAGWAFTNANGNTVDFYTGAGMLDYDAVCGLLRHPLHSGTWSSRGSTNSAP